MTDLLVAAAARDLSPAGAFLLGLALSVYGAWLFHRREKHRLFYVGLFGPRAGTKGMMTWFFTARAVILLTFGVLLVVSSALEGLPIEQVVGGAMLGGSLIGMALIGIGVGMLAYRDRLAPNRQGGAFFELWKLIQFVVTPVAFILFGAGVLVLTFYR
jgi:sterol desaturase/sphingolipid hydroxylase (fatty acid hydroxylase superfamily)